LKLRALLSSGSAKAFEGVSDTLPAHYRHTTDTQEKARCDSEGAVALHYGCTTDAQEIGAHATRQERSCATCILRLEGIEDPKIRFHETIKSIEARLGDPRMVLASFIVSNTPYAQLPDWGASKKQLEDRHVLFQYDDPGTYIEKMLDRIPFK
jgi:hypothetical protein